MTLGLNCTQPSCKGNQLNFEARSNCPFCQSELAPQWDAIPAAVADGIRQFPPQIARPLFLLYASPHYFKRLHLISDVLLGALRLYGFTLMQLARDESRLDEATEQVCATLTDKDSHGLWSSFIAGQLSALDLAATTSVAPAWYTAFGVTAKNNKQAKIKRLTIRNTVIDGKGKKQTVEVTNTPLELLINFRNRYVGHGTVYSEDESRDIFNVYEPVLLSFVEALNALDDIVFNAAGNSAPLQGYKATVSTPVEAALGAKRLTLPQHAGLVVEEWKGLSDGKYRCNTPDCELNNAKVFFAEEGACPSCSNQLILSTDAQHDEWDRIIMDTYPYFLAHTYRRALVETEGFKKLHLLKETFLNYLKYLGLLTASEYFNSDLKLGDINRAFKNFLYRPQFGHWNAFMRSAVQALNESGHNWFVRELPAYYHTIETVPYAETGDTAIGKLIRFRNHYLGHGTVPSDAQCDQLWSTYSALLKQLLVQMAFCRNYTIVSSDKTVSWRLMGNNIAQVNLREKLKTNVAALDTSGNQLSLVPFFILPGEYFIREVSDRAKMMVYEQNTGSRLVFFSPESVHGETNNEKVLEQLNLMIREKERREPFWMADLDAEKWRALLKESNEDTLQSLLSEKKIIKGIYQERQDAEIELRSWVGARAGLFFLAAEAGSGKTNLLVEMNRQYNERGIDTLLLRGNRFRTGNLWEEIRLRLNLSEDVAPDKTGFLPYTQENPLIILIDGGNEHSASQKLFNSILEFLDQNRGGHLKIVLSWRVNTRSELPQAPAQYEDLVYSNSSDKSREESIIARSCYWLKPLNKVEVEGAWNKYTGDKQDKVKRKPNFSYEELTYHDRSLSDQLDNPLLLRLFLEMYNGKGLPKSRGGFISIWTLYHERLIAQ